MRFGLHVHTPLTLKLQINYAGCKDNQVHVTKAIAS